MLCGVERTFNMKFRNTIQLFCFILFVAFTAVAQESSEKKAEKRFLNETVKRETWSKPIFVNIPSKVSPKKSTMMHSSSMNDSAIQDDSKVSLKESLRIQGVEVFKKFHKFEKRQFFSMVESCEVENDALEVSYNEFDYLLDGFTSYEVKGKVFAYQANFWFIQPEDGYEIGAGILPIYVDEEGNGNFKLRCDDKTELKSLPKWIKPLGK